MDIQPASGGASPPGAAAAGACIGRRCEEVAEDFGTRKLDCGSEGDGKDPAR